MCKGKAKLFRNDVHIYSEYITRDLRFRDSLRLLALLDPEIEVTTNNRNVGDSFQLDVLRHFGLFWLFFLNLSSRRHCDSCYTKEVPVDVTDCVCVRFRARFRRLL